MKRPWLINLNTANLIKSIELRYKLYFLLNLLFQTAFSVAIPFFEETSTFQCSDDIDLSIHRLHFTLDRGRFIEWLLFFVMLCLLLESDLLLPFLSSFHPLCDYITTCKKDDTTEKWYSKTNSISFLGKRRFSCSCSSRGRWWRDSSCTILLLFFLFRSYQHWIHTGTVPTLEILNSFSLLSLNSKESLVISCWEYWQGLHWQSSPVVIRNRPLQQIPLLRLPKRRVSTCHCSLMEKYESSQICSCD